MNSSFTIEFQKRDGNLHVQPQGDFDGASAWELLNFLHEQYNGHGSVFIDTNRLRRIHPFGCDTFKCRLKPKRVPADRLFFEGKKGPELAPSGSKILASPENHVCRCNGRCAHCSCAEKQATIQKETFIDFSF
ncbi:MAG: peptidylprolyl isomerase [Pseudomonadota bacterium]